MSKIKYKVGMELKHKVFSIQIKITDVYNQMEETQLKNGTWKAKIVKMYIVKQLLIKNWPSLVIEYDKCNSLHFSQDELDNIFEISNMKESENE